MATNRETLVQYAHQMGLATQDVDDFVAIKVPVEVQGDNGEIALLMRTYDEGEMFEAFTINFIPTDLIKQSKHSATFMFHLLNTAWDTKFGTPEMDKDGEVRVTVEFPLVDAQLTFKQMERVVKTISKMTVQLALEGIHILKTGELVQEKVKPNLEQMAGTFGMMVTVTEGREQLQSFIADADCPEDVRRLARIALETWQRACNTPSEF